MNEAVYKFKRYGDSSLEYNRLRKHDAAENVSLFYNIISRADYESMEVQQ